MAQTCHAQRARAALTGPQSAVVLVADLEQGLRVVDAAAFSLCQDNLLPMRVFGMGTATNVTRALRGEKIGTLVSAAR